MADSGSAGGRGGDRGGTVVVLEEEVEVEVGDVDVDEEGVVDKQKAKSGYQSQSWDDWSKI